MGEHPSSRGRQSLSAIDLGMLRCVYCQGKYFPWHCLTVTMTDSLEGLAEALSGQTLAKLWFSSGAAGVSVKVKTMTAQRPYLLTVLLYIPPQNYTGQYIISIDCILTDSQLTRSTGGSAVYTVRHASE